MKADYTVVVTRPDGESFAESLRALGFSVILMPLFQVVPFQEEYTPESLKRDLENADWLLFTSRNGVRFFSSLVGDSLPDGLRVAAIGSRTGEMFKELFKRAVDYQGEGQSSEKFAPGLFSQIGRGARILLPTARQHRPVIGSEALARGVHLTEVPIYQRVSCEISADMLAKLHSLAAKQLLWPFFSPSAFIEFLHRSEEFKRVLGEGLIVAIGDTTSAAIRECGFEISGQAAIASEAGMLEALVKCVSDLRKS